MVGRPGDGAEFPRLLFVHFEGTSFVAENDAGYLVGFLVGFQSQTEPTEAYVHFIGVAPEERGTGLGRELYDRFAAAVRGHGCTTVHAVTSTANEASVAFHTKLGFEVERVAADYDGPGEDRVLLVRRL